jgi:hypothetical protein
MPLFHLVPGTGVTVQQLRDVKDQIFASGEPGFIGITADRVEVTEPSTIGAMKPVSRNLFGLWTLYVEPPSDLWENAYLPWAPAFPSDESIKAVHDYIVNAGKKEDSSRPAADDRRYRISDESRTVQTTIYYAKIENAAGEPRDPTQQAVMNGVSATYVRYSFHRMKSHEQDTNILSTAGPKWELC